MKIYFDNAATTAVYEQAAKKAYEVMTLFYGNPSSLHTMGIEAGEMVNSAREQISQSLNCNKNEILFTSGGTEGNNLAIFGAANALKRRGNRIITTAIEHPSVLNAFLELEKQGFEVKIAKPHEDILAFINEQTILVSTMLVNNETGAIMPMKGIKQALKRANEKALLHCDGVQAYGKIPIHLEGLGIDLLTMSGHKLHAPKGVGALYIKKGTRILPTLFGGGQEVGLRSGTENTAGIAGFGEAVKIKFVSFSSDRERIKGLKEYLLQKLEDLKPNIVMNSPIESIPHIINFSVLGIRSEILLHFLESKGVFVSSGSACSSSKGVSYVLKEMKLPRNVADSAIRVSFSAFNTKEEIDYFLEKLSEAREILSK